MPGDRSRPPPSSSRLCSASCGRSEGKGHVALTGFEPEWALPTYRIVRMVAIAFALVVAYPYIPGSRSAAFQSISIFLMFSIGSSS